jgi:hypothetical protein
MKKISFIILSSAALLLTGTGCLKDKAFEAQQYGIQVAEVKGVAFPQASKEQVVAGSINSQTTPSVIQGPYITLEEDAVAATDVTVTVQLNDALITAANTDLDLALEPIPAGSYTLSSLSVVIPAGQKLSDALKITVPNSTLLDPTITYALGFTITAVDKGYTIAGNQKNIVIAFSIKNKYDGVYKLKLRSTGWAAYGIADGVAAEYSGTFDFITVGANSNSTFSSARQDNLLPAFAGNTTAVTGYTAFGATTPLFVFDNATNALTDVINTTPDDGRGRTLEINPAVTDSRYDPTSKVIYASFIMKQNGRPNQIFYDTLTYIKER